MANTYSSPRLSMYGGVNTLTGVFGNPSTGDVAYNLSGDVIQEGGQSIDSCPTDDADDCTFDDTP